MAQDTGGEAAAGPSYDAAEATFVTLIDEKHLVTALYGMVNVPMGVWIDEEGQIVRPPEVAYSKVMSFAGQSGGHPRYVEALRDWVQKGKESHYVVPKEELQKRLASKNLDRPLADAHFALAVHLHASGDAKGAAVHFSEAQRLDPENWNYHRQEWSFDPATAGAKWRVKFERLAGKPYYAPLDLRMTEE